MRLLVFVPAFDEEASIADVLRRVPRTLAGVSTVDIVVIDDGSGDHTADRAREAGAIVLRHTVHRGLAAAFRTGVQYTIEREYDLIVTLDADGQYRPEEITLLLTHLQETGADLVVGDRSIERCHHMPFGHRIGNLVGSYMLRLLGRTNVRDASSGFRIFTSRLARALHIESEHTYTHEMLIQASAYGSMVAEIPVTFLPRSHGRSKLVRTLWHHIFRSCGTILRSLFLYRPLKKFFLLAGGCLVASAVLLAVAAGTRDAVPILISFVFGVLGLQFVLLGLIADAHAARRRIMDEFSGIS